MAKAPRQRSALFVPAVIGLVLVTAVGVLAFAIFRPLQVLPRIRPVPPWVLTDHTGHPVSSADLQGKVVLVGFLATRDPAVPQRLQHIKALWAEVVGGQAHLAGDGANGNGSADLQVALITVDPEHDDPPTLAAFAAANDIADDSWYLLTGTGVSVKLVVGSGLEVFYGPIDPTAPDDGPPVYEPVLVLLDGTGMIRGRYSVESLDTTVLLRDLALLRREEASTGTLRLGYEAAHLFLCYPR